MSGIRQFIEIDLSKGHPRAKSSEITELLYTKGDGDEVKNWRQIRITNALYRIFSCIMARYVQTMNRKVLYTVSSDERNIKFQ
jgi:hypothetical protein